MIRFDGSMAGADGVRHLGLVYYHYVGLSFSQFLVELWHTLTFQISTHSGIRDPYKHIVSYLTGGVLGAPGLFFPVVAFVYGYFFTGSLLQVFKSFGSSRLNYVIIFFAAMFILMKNIEGVNTVRTWTGMWILVYACLMYYDTKKWRYIALMLTPPFVHIGFWIMVIPALAVLIFGNRPVLYAVLFVASSFTNFIPQDRMLETISRSDRGELQVRSYLVDERTTVESRLTQQAASDQRFWRVFQRAGVQKWGLNILIYAVLAAGIYFGCMTYLQRSLFSVGLLTLTLSNSTWFLFALSNRSWIIGAVFILGSFVMANTQPESRSRIIQSNQPPYYKWGLHLSLLLFLPYFLYNLSVLLDYPSVFWLTAPFMVWLDPDINMSWKYLLQVLMGLR